MKFEEFKELMRKDRSYRRFDQNVRIGQEDLKELVGLGRYCPSGRNLQPLKYRIVHEEQECAGLFPYLLWAGYLKDWPGPEEGERPVAYLVQCLDTSLTETFLCDDGLQLEAITLGSVVKGYGCCIIKAFNTNEVKRVLSLPEEMKPLSVIAIGKPKEKVVIDDMVNGKIEYWRDAESVHHVPKRSEDELIIVN